MAKSKKTTTKKLTKLQKVGNDLKAPALVILGVIGGNIVGQVIDNALKVDPNEEGINPKAMVSPVLKLTTGIAGAILFKKDYVKLVLGGVAASGLASSVKVLLKKDVLDGFKGLGKTEALKKLKESIKIEKYDPYLPELDTGEVEAEPEVVVIEKPDGKINYDDYEEVEELDLI